jgi:DNA-binding MarR family transcriptional regulator
VDDINFAPSNRRDEFPVIDSFPSNDRPAPHLVLATLRTARLLDQIVARALAPHRLHYAQFNALLLLQRESPSGVRPSSIGDFLCVSRPNVTKLLARLNSRGLIEQRPDPDDGRAIRAFITRPGEHLLTKASESLRQDLGRVVALISSSDARALQALLDQFRDRISSALRDT